VQCERPGSTIKATTACAFNIDSRVPLGTPPPPSSTAPKPASLLRAPPPPCCKTGRGRPPCCAAPVDKSKPSAWAEGVESERGSERLQGWSEATKRLPIPHSKPRSEPPARTKSTPPVTETTPTCSSPGHSSIESSFPNISYSCTVRAHFLLNSSIVQACVGRRIVRVGLKHGWEVRGLGGYWGC